MPAPRSSASSPSPNPERGGEGPTLARVRSRKRSVDWLDPDATRRRELRRFLWGSALAHAVALGVLAWSPGPRVSKGPGIVTVDLVAMAAPAAGPAAARAARTASPSPAPARRAEAPTPLPRPAPPQPTPPPPEPRREAALPKPTPPPEPKKPRERAAADPKPEPKPEPVRTAEAKPPPKPEPARAEPKPEPRPAPARETPPAAAAPSPPPPAAPPRREESYDDVLASLRAERGESRPDRVAAAASAGVPGASGVAGASARGAGRPLDAEIAFWLRAAKLHVESAWVVPPGFRREALRTVVSVRLDADGRVLGAPQVRERSGNPWYDESVVRAIQKASPLPPPPEAGEWRFEFTPPGSTG